MVNRHIYFRLLRIIMPIFAVLVSGSKHSDYSLWEQGNLYALSDSTAKITLHQERYNRKTLEETSFVVALTKKRCFHDLLHDRVGGHDGPIGLHCKL